LHLTLIFKENTALQEQKNETVPTGFGKSVHMIRRLLFLALVLGTSMLHAQSPAMFAANEGIWEGYDGEWRYVSRLLVSLADSIPADKYAWRPAPGVRSVSEVLMHIAQSNYYLLSATGPKMPHELERSDIEKTIVSKPEVIAYLRRSLDAVRTARAQLKPGDLQRKVLIEGETVTADGMYLRIICHDNEHMGQLIAYARDNGIVPPWSAGVVLPK
jgi:uncharacterized damage-inducible protein DinB